MFDEYDCFDLHASQQAHSKSATVETGAGTF